jgi:hypothetical protein
VKTNLTNRKLRGIAIQNTGIGANDFDMPIHKKKFRRLI